MKEKILVISNNPFSLIKNNGKTLSSFFEKYPSENVFQLYFSKEIPDNLNYHNFYSINELDILKRKHGEVVYSKKSNNYLENRNKKIKFDFLKRNNLIRFFRESIWLTMSMEGIYEWLDNIRPDKIFFCASDCGFAYDIAKKIKKKYKSQLAVYITDDYFISYKSDFIVASFRKKYLNRKLKYILNESDFFYTISEEMQKKYNALFNKPSKVLINNVYQEKREELKNIKDKNFHFIYTGGFHLNRDETLSKLVNAINIYNSENFRKIFFDIYSTQKLSKRLKKSLEKSIYCKYYGSISAKEVEKKLFEADVFVHIESFHKNDIKKTYLSISTKIPEYLAFGKPIFAIGPMEIASMKELSHCALCINSPDKIIDGLLCLTINEELYMDLSKKAAIVFKKKYMKQLKIFESD